MAECREPLRMQTNVAALSVTCELERGHDGRHHFDFTAPRLGMILNRDATFLEWDHDAL